MPQVSYFRINGVCRLPLFYTSDGVRMDVCRSQIFNQHISEVVFQHLGRGHVTLIRSWLFVERRILFQVTLSHDRERQRLLFLCLKVSTFSDIRLALGKN